MYQPDQTDADDRKCDEEFWQRNEYYWAQLDGAERERLSRPHTSQFRCYFCGAAPAGDPDGKDHHTENCARPIGYNSRCAFCGGIGTHSHSCKELHTSWEPTLPYGTYKGRPISQVPLPHLGWLHREATLPAELRQAIESVLRASLR